MFPSKRSDLYVTADAEMMSQSYSQLTIAMVSNCLWSLVVSRGAHPRRCKVRRRARQRQLR